MAVHVIDSGLNDAAGRHLFCAVKRVASPSGSLAADACELHRWSMRLIFSFKRGTFAPAQPFKKVLCPLMWEPRKTRRLLRLVGTWCATATGFTEKIPRRISIIKSCLPAIHDFEKDVDVMVTHVAPASSPAQSHHHADSISDPVLSKTSPHTDDDRPPSARRHHIHHERPSARKNFAEVPLRPAIVRTLLNDVRNDTDQLPPDVYTDEIADTPNDSEVRCIQATMVKVPSREGDNTRALPAHINQINFEPDTETPNAASIYRAGQSPAGAVATTPSNTVSATLSSACEKALVEGIDSGLGLYQFVSRKAHYQPGESKETPIIRAIHQRWHEKKQGEQLILGGRYAVTGFQQHSSSGGDRLHYLLTVCDVDNPDNTRVVPLTQAGLQFTGRLLKAREIETASAILDAHRTLISTDLKETVRQAEPTIYSHAGIGRNATLITYRRLSKLFAAGKITDETALAAALRNTIRIERAACGKRFLHSEAQINALWLALSANLVKHHDKNRSNFQRDSGNGDVADDANSQVSQGIETDIPLSTHTVKKQESGLKNVPITALAPQPHMSADRRSDLGKPGNAASERGSKSDIKSDIKLPATVATATEGPHVSAVSQSGVSKLNLTTSEPSDEATSMAHTVLHAAVEITGKTHKPIKLATHSNPQPDVIPIRIAHPTRRPSVRAIATDPFEVLEQPDNPKHANWIEAARLIQRHDPAKYQRFVDAFDKQFHSDPGRKPEDPPEKGLVKHLSDFQLAALRKHLTDPEDPTKKAQPREEEESEKIANALAIVRALAGKDVDSGAAVRSAAAVSRAFGDEYFEILPNAGGGNCLFHSLCGRPGYQNLSGSELSEVRSQIALIRLNRPDTERAMGLNWEQIYEVLPKPELLKESFLENGIPLAITNSQIAEMQRRSGYTAGDLEIEDWLDTPGNKTQSVIVINGQIGLEAIIRFDRQAGRQPKPLTGHPNFATMSSDNVRKWIETALADALNERHAEPLSTSPPVVAVYSSPGHWERIVGLKDWSSPAQSLRSRLMQGTKNLAERFTAR